MADCVSRRGKRKTTQFRVKYLCGSLYYYYYYYYSTLKASFQPYAFYNKRLQMLFKDQLMQAHQGWISLRAKPYSPILS